MMQRNAGFPLRMAFGLGINWVRDYGRARLGKGLTQSVVAAKGLA